MTMQPSFWAKSFGMLTDQFGTPWVITVSFCQWDASGSLSPVRGNSGSAA